MSLVPRPLPTQAIAAAVHAAELVAPFFAPGGGTSLHRFQETEFVPRFLNDLAAGRLADPIGTDWWREDRFSDHDDRLVLRLPVHRTFYLVACEAVCARLGHPALDPARIRSAGFVIRRIGGPPERVGSRKELRRRERAGRMAAVKQRLLGRGEGEATRAADGVERAALELAVLGTSAERAWVLEEGEPLGWLPAVSGGRDPDLGRRPCLNGVLRRDPAPPAYTGEETHPLHVAAARDPAGKLHTVLYGFLPLGGQYIPSGNPFDAAAEDEAVEAERVRLHWPFGWRGRPGRTWQDEDGAQVSRGRPSTAFFALLEVLVNRYHLGESRRGDRDPLNEGLTEAARGLQFVDESAPLQTIATGRPGGTGDSFALDGDFAQGGGLVRLAYPARFSLWDYLESCFAAGEDNPLPPWLATERRRIDDAGGLDAAPQIAPLPGPPADGGELGLSLFVEEADGEEWRTLLGERLLGQARRTGREIPVPKFLQEPEDLYQVVPFARVLDDQGKERCLWAGPGVRSEPFRVAAPFDPDASRPVPIQMPGLGDLKRGLAKGAAMLIPPDTQAFLNALKLDKGAGPDVVGEPPPEGAQLGIQWICSFSLPVITLVALILLMIMVIILNLIFFWLPWVRICLPFPKIKEN